MKRSIFFTLLLLITTLVSCSESDKKDPVSALITGVEVISPRTSVAAETDNFTHTVSLKFPQGESLKEVSLQISLAASVKMVSPAGDNAVFDLSSGQASFTVLSGKQEVTYKIRASFYYPPVTEMFTEWEQVTTFGELPANLFLFKAPAQLDEKNVEAYIAVADMNQGARFGVIGEKSGLNTPSGFYDANGKPSVILNAGYFYGANALSLICRNGQLICPNLQSMNRTDGVSSVPFYPTRSVFALKADGAFRADWVYTVEGVTYAYPQPSPNRRGDTPQAQPSAEFPAGATVWSAATAVGGGPMLIKDGVVKNTWKEELCDEDSGIGATQNNPRSAIGITRFNHLVFFVCEGRNKTPGVPGLTLEEVAGVLQSLGCVDAVNLDGGGSSCMLVNGQQLIKPSDGSQRSVSSCVTLY